MSELTDRPGAAPENHDEADDGQMAIDAAASTEQMPEEPDRDWRAEYLRETAQSRKYRQRAQRAENEVEQFRASVLDERQRAEYDRLRKGAAGAAEKNQRIEALEGVVRRIVGVNELTGALVACGVGSGCLHGEKMVSQAAALLARRIDVDAGGDDPQVRVLNKAGQVALNHSGEPVSVAAFVASWLAEEGSHFLPASGDTGSGAHSGTAGGRGTSIEQLDRDPTAKAEFIAKHGPKAYVQLAQRR